jgi:hypothetical protein
MKTAFAAVELDGFCEFDLNNTDHRVYFRDGYFDKQSAGNAAPGDFSDFVGRKGMF